MIRGFRDRVAETVFRGESPKGFPPDLVKIARRKLGYLDAALDLRDLRQPPGNHLEALKGDRQGQHSIRINEPVSNLLPVDTARPERRRSDGLPLGDTAMPKKLPPLHPGEVLREEFLVPLGVSAGTLAKAMAVPRTRVERIASESIGITADTALRLGKALGTSAQLWLNLQNRFDVETAERAIGKELARISRVKAA
jgi:addiction module HigA family antidote